MLPDLLAQTDSTNVSDFLGQITGLLALTCAAGIVWVILMALVMQRAAERRRRAAQGLPPLPGIHVAASRALMRWINPAQSETPSREKAPPSRSTKEPLAPDLSLLTGNLPTPDLSDMLDVPDEPEDLFEPALEPEPAIVPPAERDQLEHAFPLDDLEPEEEIPMPTQTAPADRDAPQDAVELLRVWRDISDGSLIIEIAGRRFRTLADLRSADLERRFLNVVRDLAAIAQRKEPAPPAAKPVRQEPAAGENDIPSMAPGSMLRQMTRVAMGQGPDPVEPVVERSIADQIEDLLQDRLATLPEYKGRKIHVRPSVDGGVRIEVDGKFFDGVGDVDDPQVKDLLLGVVREWELKQ